MKGALAAIVVLILIGGGAIIIGRWVLASRIGARLDLATPERGDGTQPGGANQGKNPDLTNTASPPPTPKTALPGVMIKVPTRNALPSMGGTV